MKPGLPLWCMLLLAAVSLNASLAGAHEATAAEGDGTYYFGIRDGALVLSSLPPSSSSETKWTTSGSFSPRDGLNLVIPLENPDPDVIVDETAGVRGWVVASYSYTTSGLLTYPYYGGGSFSWRLVQGAQSATLKMLCGNNDNYCNSNEPRYYAAEFPGHSPERPHTHGDGSDAERPHYAGDFHWELMYKVAPCSMYSCPVLGGNVEYKFSVLVDGTTDLHFVAQGVKEPEPVAEPVADNATEPADNGTANGTDPGSGDPGSGNQTGNQTGNGTSGSANPGAPPAFRPAAYKSEPSGVAPGAPLAALIVGSFATAWTRRRLRRA